MAPYTETKMGRFTVDSPDANYRTYDPYPRLNNYRKSLPVPVTRPTVEDLHDPIDGSYQDAPVDQPGGEEVPIKGLIKFGWIRGVFIRGLLSIWGATIFMRMGWMGGEAGLIQSLLMVLLATIITVITTTSMSVLCTNGQVKGGGPYYLVSRSIGPEIGAAVGVLFSVANCSAVAMYVVAAAETVRDILRVHGIYIFSNPSGINDVRLIALGFLLLVVFVTFMGMDFESQTQVFLLICITASFTSYFVGAFMPTTDVKMARGFVGWNATVAKENLYPAYTEGQSFVTIFSVFFPSVIGILSGASISGDLKDPSSAIPKGTFWAIGVTSLSYATIVIFLCCSVVRYATGNVADLVAGNFTDCCIAGSCPYGLIQYYQIMEMIAAFGPLIYVGIFAATISSALAAQVAAPRLLQALAKDGVFPILKFFGQGRGPNDNPFRASILCVIIAFLFMLIGDLNAISPYISLFFILTFGAINFAAFHAALLNSPGFRPDFKFFNKYVSLLGTLICIAVMFLLDIVTAFVTTILAIVIIVYVYYKKPGVIWGSSTEGSAYVTALKSLHKMYRMGDHVKNYRPSVLVLSGNPGSRVPLVDLGHQITRQAGGMLICGHVLMRHLSYKQRLELEDVNIGWLRDRDVRAFYSQLESDDFAQGAYSLMQAAGIGKMNPNIVLMGFISNYSIATSQQMDDYIKCIHFALDLHISIAMLRLPNSEDLARHFEDENGLPLVDAIDPINSNLKKKKKEESPVQLTEKFTKISVTMESLFPDPVTLEKVNRFRRITPSSIDVWWISDDGGLTLLLPYLLTTRKEWSHCPLKIYSVAANPSSLMQEQIRFVTLEFLSILGGCSLINLLKKFRIECKEVRVLQDLEVQPSPETVAKFESTISRWTNVDPGDANYLAPEILANYAQKTRRYLRISELLKEHSSKAGLVVVTAPVPRKRQCPGSLYLAWLNQMTSGLPPCLLVRGNQDEVLTTYS